MPEVSPLRLVQRVCRNDRTGYRNEVTIGRALRREQFNRVSGRVWSVVSKLGVNYSLWVIQLIYRNNGGKVKLGAYADAARGSGAHLRDIGP